MSLTILFESDSHIRSAEPKAPVPWSSLSLKRKITRSRPFQYLANRVLIPTYEKLCDTEANLKPHISVEELRSLTPQIADAINLSNPNFQVFGGDLYDLSSTTPGRDRERQKDVFQASKELVDKTNKPILFLPGNSDGIQLKDIKEMLDDLKKISGNSWDIIQGIADVDYKPYMDENGNFRFKIEDCLVIGLNSVLPGEFGYPDDVNKPFFEDSLTSCKRKVPIIVFTHHSPFPVLPWYFQKIGEGLLAQKWLEGALKDYTQKTKQSALIACGHCHQWLFETDEDGLSKLCNLPMSAKNRNVGSLIKVEEGKFEVERLRF